MRYLATLAAVVCLAAPALADWPGVVAKWDYNLQGVDSYGAASWIDYDTPSDALTADDFLCASPDPVVEVRFNGWSYYGNDYIDKFRVQFWTDVPATPVDASHPGNLVYSYEALKADPNDPLKIGWQDMLDGSFKIDLPQDQWFHQEGTPANPIVYWVSIQGVMVTDGAFDGFYWNFKDRTLPTWGDDAAFTSEYFAAPPWYNWGIDATGAVSLYDGVLPADWLQSLDMAYALYTIPEPATLLLLGIGAVLLRRR